MKNLVPIIMGSIGDIDVARKIGSFLDDFKVRYAFRVASAHKVPEYLVPMLNDYDAMTDTSIVYGAVVGRQPGLPGAIAGNTIKPVVFCAVDTNDTNLLSSLDMPSGISYSVFRRPDNAALEIVKIMAMNDTELQTSLKKYQASMKDSIIKADAGMRRIDALYIDILDRFLRNDDESVRVVRLVGKYADVHQQYLRNLLKGMDVTYISMPPKDFVEASDMARALNESKKRAVIIDSRETRGNEYWHDYVFTHDMDTLAKI